MSTFDLQGNDETLPRGALRHELAKRLLVEIFQGRLPEGTRLIAMNLAARFGVSCTPVREALFELEASEMIEVIHNRGAVVKRFGPDELREIFQMRRIIESEAARLACTRIDEAVLKNLRQTLEKLAKQRRSAQWFESEMAVDRQLHALIAANCGNSRLANEYRKYNMLVEVLRDVVGNERRALHTAIQTHLAILDAMIVRDPDAAAAAMTEHMEQACRSAELALFGQKSRD